jgi:hypothetical protein
MKMTKLTITEMKRRNLAQGQHWFSKGAMSFFNTRVEAQPNKNNVFITSEHTGDENRKFTLRQFDTATNKVETVGEFMEYETLAEAKEARKNL